MLVGTLGNCLTVAYATCTGTGVLKVFGHMVYTLKANVLIVLTAVIGIAVAYLLYKFAWRKIKGTVK